MLQVVVCGSICAPYSACSEKVHLKKKLSETYAYFYYLSEEKMRFLLCTPTEGALISHEMSFNA